MCVCRQGFWNQCGLAMHYFSTREKTFLAAMRHVLELYKQAVKTRLVDAKTSYECIVAIIDGKL